MAINLLARRSWPTDIHVTMLVALRLLALLAAHGWGKPGWEWVRVDDGMLGEGEDEIADSGVYPFTAEQLLHKKDWPQRRIAAVFRAVHRVFDGFCND